MQEFIEFLRLLGHGVTAVAISIWFIIATIGALFAGAFKVFALIVGLFTALFAVILLDERSYAAGVGVGCIAAVMLKISGFVW